MKRSVFVAIGSPAIRPHHSFWMAFCALPPLFMLVLSLSFAAGQVRAQCGSLGAPSTTWSDGNGSWDVAGNWTSGAPSASTNACILDGTSAVTLDTNGSAKGLQIASGNSLTFINSSSVVLSLGSGASINYGLINAEFRDTITNSGTLTNAGSLFFTNGGGLYNSGTFINTAIQGGFDQFAFYIDQAGFTNTGAFYNYGTTSNEGGIANNSGASIINYGTLNSFDFSLVTNSGAFLNTSGGTLNLSQAVLTNYGTFSNAGTLSLTNLGSRLDNYGTLLNTSGATLSTDSVSTLTNTGTIINGGTISNNGTINNNSGATLINVGTLNNSGTVNNSGTFLNFGAVAISNSGLFTTSINYTQIAGSTLVDGTLTATGGAIVNILGGALGGTGTINGNVVMGGTLTPGALGAPGAITIFGNYEQTGNGTFDELMGPLSHSFLDVSGNVSLDSGAFLDITLLDGYDPLNQTFSIMDFAVSERAVC